VTEQLIQLHLSSTLRRVVCETCEVAYRKLVTSKHGLAGIHHSKIYNGRSPSP